MPSKIGVFVDGASAQRGPNVVANKFFAKIFDVGGGSTGGESLFAGGFEVFLLADVADHGDHFAAVIFAEPGNDDGRIESRRNRPKRLSWVCGQSDSLRFLSSVRQQDLGVKRVQDGFLHVHTIFGLLQDNGIRSVEHFVGHFRAAVRRKTVHEDGVRSGLLHEFAIHLVGLEDLAANLFFGFKTHAGPGIGIDGLGAVDGFLRIGEELNLGAGFLGDTLGIGDDIRRLARSWREWRCECERRGARRDTSRE